METWNEMSEHGYRHGGSAASPAAIEVLDRMVVGIRAAFALRWEPLTQQEFAEDLDFGEAAT